MSKSRTASALVRGLERFEHATARTLLGLAGRLPEPLKRRIAKTIDGGSLHPEVQVLLALRELSGLSQLSGGSPELARARMRRDARVHAGPPIAVGSVRDLTIDGPAGPLRARHYTPLRANFSEPRPIMLFFHGGGFCLGDLDTHDQPCRALCRELNIHVLSAEYRLAPEHPFPAALDDAQAALRYVQAHAAKLGADPARISVGGDSAGANLATVVTQLAKRAGEPLPSMQLLIYPTVDSTREWPSTNLFAVGYFLTRDDIHWFRKNYLGAHTDLADLRVSPLLAPDLAGLPPTLIVTASFDPLRDEGEAYAEALRAAGVHVELHRAPGLIHGFINLGALSPASTSALREVASKARSLVEAKR
jgi:acetyl esterase